MGGVNLSFTAVVKNIANAAGKARDMAARRLCVHRSAKY